MNILGTIPKRDGYSDWDCERFHHEDSSKDEKRPTFEIDKARIIHSASFRRLQGKTQVLGVGARDFYRTRLTHSLEVAQIGRGLCRETKDLPEDFNINQDLVEAICLAHDIGHPAFGHSGEATLNDRIWTKGGFGANPQNLRLVTFLESKHPDGGLNLSRAMLDGIIKYSKPFDGSGSSKDRPHFTYKEDAELVNNIKGDRTVKSIEAEIADWADAVAYCVDDIEDSFRAGLLDFYDMKTRAEEICEQAKRKIKKSNLEDDSNITPAAVANLAMTLHERFVQKPTLRKRKEAIKSWTSETIGRLIRDCRIVVRVSSETSNRYKYGLQIPPEAKRQAILLKVVASVLVFSDPRVRTLEYKGGIVLGKLFDVFVEHEDNELLPLDFQELMKDAAANPNHGSRERLITDFLAGMTDHYAFQYYNRLFLPGEGSFYEAV
jgi:dGTPase